MQSYARLGEARVTTAWCGEGEGEGNEARRDAHYRVDLVGSGVLIRPLMRMQGIAYLRLCMYVFTGNCWEAGLAAPFSVPPLH